MSVPLSKGAIARLKREWLDNRKGDRPMPVENFDDLNELIRQMHAQALEPSTPEEWAALRRSRDAELYREIEANNRKARLLIILALFLSMMLAIGMTVVQIVNRQPALEIVQPLRPEAP